MTAPLNTPDPDREPDTEDAEDTATEEHPQLGVNDPNPAGTGSDEPLTNL